MAGKQKTHKVSKGDTLEGIAKKYKHKSWKTIWNDPANKGVKSKRKEPRLIRAGDVFVIPANEAEKKAQAAAISSATAQLAQESLLASTLLAKAGAYDDAAKAAGVAAKAAQQEIKKIDKAIASLRGVADISIPGFHATLNTTAKASCALGMAQALTAAQKIAKLAKTSAKAASFKGPDLGAEGKAAVKANLDGKGSELGDLADGLKELAGIFKKVTGSPAWKMMSSATERIQTYGLPFGAHEVAAGGKVYRSGLALLLPHMAVAKTVLSTKIVFNIAQASVAAAKAKTEAQKAQARAKAATKEMSALTS